MSEQGQGVPKRLLTGRVISDKMEKTCVVTVERVYKDPRYKKVMRATKKYSVHDDADVARVGDIVEIYEGRPTSKTKYMYLNRVIESASANVSKAAGISAEDDFEREVLSSKAEKKLGSNGAAELEALVDEGDTKEGSA